MAMIGTPVLRIEDNRLITGRGTYVDNLRGPVFDDALFLTFVRSPIAHARLVAVDLTAARAAPGVVAAFAAPDLDLAPREPPFIDDLPPAIAQPYLATDTLRFVGEPIAMVVAQRCAQGADAADLVTVEYETLAPVVSPEQGLDPGVLLFPDSGSNIVYTVGEVTDDAFVDFEVVIEQRMVNQRVAAAPMEPRSYTCLLTADQRMVLWASTQNPHMLRDEIVEQLRLNPGVLRVVAPDVGGGFGAKGLFDPEAILVCWLARKLGRGIRWTETRSESMATLGHGRAQWQTVTLAGDRDGTLRAYRLDVVADAGAYPRVGAVLPEGTVALASGVYAIPRVEARSRSVLTNTSPTGPYRGAGRPEAIAAIERAVDMFAVEIGMDPARVRLLNLLPPEAFPHVTPSGSEFDSGDYPAAMQAVLAAADYPALRAEQAGRRALGHPLQYGIGLSAYVDMTGTGEEHARLVLRRDGTVLGFTGTSPHGQGHQTAFAMIVADVLGLPIERVAIGFGDTDQLPRGGGTFGSRSLQAGGSALNEAAHQLRERVLPIAASFLGAGEDDVDIDAATGHWFIRDEPGQRVSWTDLAGRGLPSAGLSAEVEYKFTTQTCPFGVHLAVVEVDTETGRVRLLRLIAVDDAGTVVNPLIAEGQRHGGIAQGIGQALFEEVLYDEVGNPMTVTLADYTIPSAADLPTFELVAMQTPTPVNALGVKGIGESGTIGATPAVQNAVIDAVAHLGVRHIDMPLTPERVWLAITSARPH